MSRVVYLDCFSGISGDMVLGAFLDAGLPFEALRDALGSLAVDGLEIASERVLRAGISATRFVVHGEVLAGHELHAAAHRQRHAADGQHHRAHSHAPTSRHDHGHRSLPEIFRLIDRSALSAAGRDRAKALFERLAVAEAEVHRMPLEEVHLHEVGALDSIIDIVGGVFAFEWAGADRVVCSPLNLGGGMVESAHGLLPVPAPATLKLLGDAPVYSGAVQKELVTPTGALLATAYATAYGSMPAMRIAQTGYGAGTRDNPGTPNALRVLIGEDVARSGDRVVVIECEIDDMNPQLFGSAMERLYAAGALEVFYVPVQMKKNRPGTLLTVIGPPARLEPLADIIFRETTTIGLRHSEVERQVLQRETIVVETPLGRVRFKIASHDGHVLNAAPEFEDCAAMARETGRSVKDVQALAMHAYGDRRGGTSTS